MAFPIIALDQQNVKLTPPPVPPSYKLGLIPAGDALRRMKHYLYPEGKAAALAKLEEWSRTPTFLEGQCYVDAQCTTAIATAFFLEDLPPYASCWEGQTYIEVGNYPYLSSPSDILRTIFRHNLNGTFSPGRSTTQQLDTSSPAWQQTDITGDLIELSQLVEVADQREVNEQRLEATASTTSTCEQRFSEKQLVTLAQALYRTPYSIRRYSQREAWDTRRWVWYLEPDSCPTSGKRFALEAKSFGNPSPWNRPPCTFLTASTSYNFADPVQQRTMTTLWNAAHTPTRHACVARKLPKLLQKGIGRRAQ